MFDPTEDPITERAYERLCEQQGTGIAALKAAATAFRAAVLAAETPLGFPGAYDRDEVLETCDAILRAPDEADNDLAWEVAAEQRRDAWENALEARREAREAMP